MYADHYRLTVRGLLGTVLAPLEEFSYGLNLSRPLGLDGVGNLIDDVVADVTAFHGSVAAAIWNGAIVREVKLAAIGADGRYISEAAIAEVNIPGGMGGAAPQNPFQVALAISLGTGQRGASKRGRFFLPTPNVGVGSNGLISVGAADQVRNAAQTFLNNLNNWPGLESNSPKVTIASIKGFNTDVTEVRVGRALDTIRSRRGGLPEAYTVPVPVN